MSLLAFMNYMTDHPDEMAAYKRDSQAFFEKHPDIALTEADQRAVQRIANCQSLTEEATTVFRMATSLGPGLVANVSRALPHEAICLMGVAINVYAHSEAHVFFAEPKAGTMSCMTLRHSYLHIPNKQDAYFDLHLCCTDPEDKTDRPQVLYIRTAKPTQPPEVAMYDHQLVSLNIPPCPGYILAVAKGARYLNKPVPLLQNSWYDPYSGYLQLNFNSYQ